MSITADILRNCKDYLGGINTFYVCNWVKYSRTQIAVTGQTLTTFPSTVVYKVEADSINFTETPSFEGGSIKYDQSFTFEMPKTAVTSELHTLLQRNSRVFYIDRIGNIRVLGLYNGLEASTTNESGGDKASLNGYKLTVTGLEDNQAYFIDDLEALGIQLGDPFNFIFQDGNNYVFQDGNNYIFN